MDRIWGHGRGCAIVFDYHLLSVGQNDGKNYALFQVLYDRTSQIKKTECTLEQAVALCKKERFEIQDWNEYWFREIPSALLICAVRFKNERYAGEREVRLYIAGGENVSPFQDGGRWRVAVPFPREAILRVERRETSLLSKEAIRSILRRCGYADLPVLDK